MGLAASQARFLMATARKHDVEYEMMNIGNEKLEISRSITNLSEEYDEKLNAKTLKFKQGTNNLDLTYDLLMHPDSKGIGFGESYMITDANGKVVLDSDLGAAAKKAGVPATGGVDPSKNTGMQEAWLGANGITGNVTNIVSMYNDPDQEISPTFEIGPYETGALDDFIDGEKVYDTGVKSGDIPSNMENVVLGGTQTWKTAYNSESIICLSSADDDITSAMKVLDAVTKDMASVYGNALKEYLIDADPDFEDAFDAIDYNAIVEDARSKTYNTFTSTKPDEDGNTSTLTDNKNSTPHSSSNKKIDDKANENCRIYARSSDVGNTNREYYVSVKQLVDTFLSYLDAGLAKYAPSGNATDPTKNINIKVDKDNYGTERNVTGNNKAGNTNCDFEAFESNEQADYLLKLLDGICEDGWVENDKVDDPEYFKNALENGTLFLNDYNNDWDEMSQNDSDCPIVEVDDDAGLAKADSQYKIKKNRLQTAETQLDLKMKELDMERAALQGQMDSIKNIVNDATKKMGDIFKA